ncbi:unnamed protein product, partial [Polarella glacialis]
FASGSESTLIASPTRAQSASRSGSWTPQASPLPSRTLLDLSRAGLESFQQRQVSPLPSRTLPAAPRAGPQSFRARQVQYPGGTSFAGISSWSPPSRGAAPPPTRSQASARSYLQ